MDAILKQLSSVAAGLVMSAIASAQSGAGWQYDSASLTGAGHFEQAYGVTRHTFDNMAYNGPIGLGYGTNQFETAVGTTNYTYESTIERRLTSQSANALGGDPCVQYNTNAGGVQNSYGLDTPWGVTGNVADGFAGGVPNQNPVSANFCGFLGSEDVSNTQTENYDVHYDRDRSVRRPTRD